MFFQTKLVKLQDVKDPFQNQNLPPLLSSSRPLQMLPSQPARTYFHQRDQYPINNIPQGQKIE